MVQEVQEVPQVQAALGDPVVLEVLAVPETQAVPATQAIPAVRVIPAILVIPVAPAIPGIQTQRKKPVL